ncbi:MAG: class I SAM-dependent methyltransferase [Chloroflexi bacterium]|nr:class I SAM-dependent methyltransferase [Chloroflexota bacterium]MBI1855700.1 class I SAM-dependent methyltransferase [Chloroflexota bacterium]MBI3341138.1 class I SAM-dependent methyltransferase [Chloroflexota bacterium]
MEYSFTDYLLAKQSVDDRALNRHVGEALVASLPAQPIRIIEVGAGIGTMLMRLIRWNVLQKADYVLVDEMAANIEYASEWIPRWAADNGLSAERSGENQLRIFDQSRDVRITFEHADVFDFIQKNPAPADLLIAHAVLDLLPMRESLPKLFSLTKNLAWFTINFDGVTSLEPVIDPALDATIERLYHESMDKRPTGGDSRTGRHLFGHLRNAGADILAAGASDWVVYGTDGKYPADEKFFLQFILHFFEETLGGHPELDANEFAAWLSKRRAQIERGELVYIAHQMDFLVKVQ